MPGTVIALDNMWVMAWWEEQKPYGRGLRRDWEERESVELSRSYWGQEREKRSGFSAVTLWGILWGALCDSSSLVHMLAPPPAPPCLLILLQDGIHSLLHLPSSCHPSFTVGLCPCL